MDRQTEANEALSRNSMAGAFRWTEPHDARAIQEDFAAWADEQRDAEARAASENTAALVAAMVVGGLLGLMAVLAFVAFGARS